MTAPAWQSSGTYRSASGSTGSFAVPSGVASGDIIVVCFFLDTQAATVTGLPSGFAHADGSPVAASAPFNHSLVVAVKRASGADSGTYDFTLSSSVFHDGQAHRFTGGTASGAILDTPSGTATDVSSSVTTPAVSMTTTGADRLDLHAGTCWAGGTWTAPASYTKIQQGGAGLSTLSYLAQASQGSTSSVTATVSNADKRAAWIGALASPAAASSSVAPASISVPVALGAPAIAQSLAVAPSSIALTAALGAPALAMAINLPGISVPLALGAPFVDGEIFVPPAGGNWESLLGIVQSARADAKHDAERRAHPIDCPDHQWPLQRVRDGVWHCMFGGHTVRGS